MLANPAAARPLRAVMSKTTRKTNKYTNWLRATRAVIFGLQQDGIIPQGSAQPIFEQARGALLDALRSHGQELLLPDLETPPFPAPKQSAAPQPNGNPLGLRPGTLNPLLPQQPIPFGETPSRAAEPVERPRSQTQTGP